MKIFLSYSWDSEDHKLWVQSLAEDIEGLSDSFEVIYDRVGMDHQVDRNFFMEQAVFHSDVMLAIITKSYSEKANLRQGGVGRETIMAVERHFTEIDRDSRSSILVIRRESDAEMPNYLKAQVYFDFSEPRTYHSSLTELFGELRAIQEQHRSRAPHNSSCGIDKPNGADQSSFTRTEDLIASLYRVRKPIFVGEQSRDFSDDRKIKYELWQVNTPHPQLLLILFENINIRQTIEHFFRQHQSLRDELRKIGSLTVLRPKPGISGYLEDILSGIGARFAITELTYKDYLSTYCVTEETLHFVQPFQEPFYIDQKLYDGREDDSKDLGPALRFLERQMGGDSSSPLTLLVASGGTGKTTLLRALAAKIETGGKSRSLLIEVSQLKELSSEQKRRAHISSIYDLCHLYYEARNPGASSVMSERALFELLLISGSVTILIDGVDEISSLLHENFDANGFIESVFSLNDELSQTRVILASREDSVAGIVSAIQDRDVPIYSLLGFSETDVKNYIQKRFARKIPKEREQLTARILGYLRTVEETHVGLSVVLPFFLDVLCEVEEESGGRTQIANVVSANLNDAGYLNNGSLVDLLIFRILERECERQNWVLPVSLLVDVFKEIASAFWGMCSDEHLADTVTTFLSIAGGDVVERFRKNPLLKYGGTITFKYDFLNAYFSSLWLIELLDGNRVTDLAARHLARYAQGQGAVFEDIVRFFRSKPEDYLLKHGAPCYRAILELLEVDSADDPHGKRTEVYKAAASAICHLVAGSHGHAMNRGVFSDHILDLPGIVENDGCRRVKRLFIHGDFPLMHFTNVEIWDSEFVGYENFTKSRFDEAKIYYSKFTGIKGANCSPSFGPHVFDLATCGLGELVDVLRTRDSRYDQEPKIGIEEFKKYFKRFYDGGAFRMKRINDLYSFSLLGFDRAVLESFLARGVLERAQKCVDEFGVAREYQRSVEKFLNENHLQKNLRKVITDLSVGAVAENAVVR